jgi:hypothetical protein
MNKGFIYNGVSYTETEKGYFFKEENGKKSRIKKAEYEQAFEEYNAQITQDIAIDEAISDEQADEWTAEIDEARQAQAEKQAESDREAEQAMGGKPKAEKRRSKDIAFEGVFETGSGADFKVSEITLTAKQVRFIQRMPEDDFYEANLNSSLWIDCYCDTIADEFNPMAVGAMVSTLREKGILAVGEDRVNGKKCKCMAFTELGRVIAKELGLN